MNQLKINPQYLPHLFSIAVGLIFILTWWMWLSGLSWPLKIQQEALAKQLHQIQVLKALPAHWEHQTHFIDVSEFMGILSKNWHDLLPQYHDIQLEELNHSQLKAKVTHVEEQSFMQWLWAMQQQYDFKVVQLTITPGAEPTIVDAQFSLEIIEH